MLPDIQWRGKSSSSRSSLNVANGFWRVNRPGKKDSNAVKLAAWPNTNASRTVRQELAGGRRVKGERHDCLITLAHCERASHQASKHSSESKQATTQTNKQTRKQGNEQSSKPASEHASNRAEGTHARKQANKRPSTPASQPASQPTSKQASE